MKTREEVEQDLLKKYQVFFHGKDQLPIFRLTKEVIPFTIWNALVDAYFALELANKEVKLPSIEECNKKFDETVQHIRENMNLADDDGEFDLQD